MANLVSFHSTERIMNTIRIENRKVMNSIYFVCFLEYIKIGVLDISKEK